VTSPFNRYPERMDFKATRATDPDRVARRHRREDLEELKRLRQEDPLDEAWLKLWSQESIQDGEKR